MRRRQGGFCGSTGSCGRGGSWWRLVHDYGRPASKAGATSQQAKGIDVKSPEERRQSAGTTRLSMGHKWRLRRVHAAARKCRGAYPERWTSTTSSATGVISSTSTSSRALEVGLSRRDRRRIDRRDDQIRAALAVGLPWSDILLGPGYKYYWDLLTADAEEARRRFGRAAAGLIDVQDRWAKAEQKAEREGRKRLGAEEIWAWALPLQMAVRQADWSRLLGRPTNVDIGAMRTAAEAAADYLQREVEEPALREDSSSRDWSWSPRTKRQFWANMRALERRLVWRLMHGATFGDLLPVLDEIRARALGDRLASMRALGDVKLAAEEEAAPSLLSPRS